MTLLKNVQPEKVFAFFEDICAIPHGSGNTAAISRYCAEFAESRALEYRVDECGNVVIRKPASKGYENHPGVILQGHLDMVCEKEDGCEIDFLHDGLRLKLDGDFLSAQGTTLGGDDGIAVAMALAVLDDDSLCHPPLEVIFTTDEETSMVGASHIDMSDITGRQLINIDSENEGVLTVSCAGGGRVNVTLPLMPDVNSAPCYTVTVSGLIGGHSGTEINKGRINSNIFMADFLHSLDFEYRIIELCGGLKDNAIPRKTVCKLATYEDITAAAEKYLSDNRLDTEPDLDLSVSACDPAASAVTAKDTKAAVELLCTLPNGVISMSQDIEGLVETSLNLGVLKTENNALSATYAVRSSVNSRKEELIEKMRSAAESFGAAFSSSGSYPAWEYKADSRLRAVMSDTFEKMYGRKPVIEAIHAGLECGIFCGKLPDLDAVSCGPDLFDIHTAGEKLSVSSVQRTYHYLCEVLRAL